MQQLDDVRLQHSRRRHINNLKTFYVSIYLEISSIHT